MSKLFCHCVALSSLLFIAPGHADATQSMLQVANVKYITDYFDMLGIEIVQNAPDAAAANMEYLLTSIYIANSGNRISFLQFPTSIPNDYSANTKYYTKQVVNLQSVWQAANRLLNCGYPGIYKHLEINESDGAVVSGYSDAGGKICGYCPTGYYCPYGSDEKIACGTVDAGYVTDTIASSACHAPINNILETDFSNGIYTISEYIMGKYPNYNSTEAIAPISKEFYYGLTVAGIHPSYYVQAMCSLTGANSCKTTGNPAYSNSGNYCWCRLRPRNAAGTPKVWMYLNDERNACDIMCPARCAAIASTGNQNTVCHGFGAALLGT